jgi:hypothetical protein
LVLICPVDKLHVEPAGWLPKEGNEPLEFKTTNSSEKRTTDMKKLLMFTCLALLTVFIAAAQTITFTTKTPFSVGNATLPAGTYSIQNVGDDLMTFQISATNGGTGVMFEADAMDNTPTTSGVTFAKYNDKLILKSFTVGGSQGYFIPLSLPEKHAKKSGAKPTKVTTAAK